MRRARCRSSCGRTPSRPIRAPELPRCDDPTRRESDHVSALLNLTSWPRRQRRLDGLLELRLAGDLDRHGCVDDALAVDFVSEALHVTAKLPLRPARVGRVREHHAVAL